MTLWKEIVLVVLPFVVVMVACVFCLFDKHETDI